MTAVKAREGALEAATTLYAKSVRGYAGNSQPPTSAIANAVSDLSADLGQYLQAASALGETEGEGFLEDVLLNIQAVSQAISQGLGPEGQALPQQALAVLKDAFESAGQFVKDALKQRKQLLPAIQSDGNDTKHLNAFMNKHGVASTFEDFSKQVRGLGGNETTNSEEPKEGEKPPGPEPEPVHTSKTMDEMWGKLQHLAEQHLGDARIDKASTIFSGLKSDLAELSKTLSKLGNDDIEFLKTKLKNECSDVEGASEFISDLLERKTV